jgi:hypothetical protein
MMSQSETVGAISAALSAAQAAMPTAAKNAKNPHLRNTYADLEAVWTAARSVLGAHGLAVVQLPVVEADQAGVSCILTHASGEWFRSDLLLPIGESRGINKAQAVGVCISYARRYTLAAMLGIATGDDTDGATTAKPKPRAQPKPAADPLDAPHHKSWEADRPRFCAACGPLGGYDTVAAFCISTGVGKPSTLTQAKRDRLIGRLEKAGAKIDAFLASDEGRALIDRVTARRKEAK